MQLNYLDDIYDAIRIIQHLLLPHNRRLLRLLLKLETSIVFHLESGNESIRKSFQSFLSLSLSHLIYSMLSCLSVSFVYTLCFSIEHQRITNTFITNRNYD